MILRCTSILLLSLLVFSEARLLVIHIDYLINLEQIKEEKCVNREVPESTCHGSCYVRKQITLTENPEEKESPKIPSELQTERVPMITSECTSFHLTFISASATKPTFHYSTFVMNPIIEVEAPPPQC